MPLARSSPKANKAERCSATGSKRLTSVEVDLLLSSIDDLSFSYLHTLLDSSYDLSSFVTIVNDSKTSVLGSVISNGESSLATRLINQGCLVNYQECDGSTPLSLACAFGNYDLISILLEKGADVNQVDGRSLVPLFILCIRGGDIMKHIRLLLSYGANVNYFNFRKYSPLMAACKGDLDGKIIRFLINKGANVKTLSSQNYTALTYAAANNTHNSNLVIDILLEYGADPNVVGNDGMYALHICVERGNVTGTESLIRYGADVNFKGSNSLSSLATAVFYGHLEIAEMLLSAGASVHAPDNIYHDSPLFIALNTRHCSKMVALLIRYNADIHFNGPYPPLVVAARNGHYSIIKALLRLGVDPNTVDKYGNTALMLSVCHENGHKIVDVLISAGAHVNVANLQQHTTLMHACVHKNKYAPIIIEKLVAAGADINAFNSYGISTLTFAIRENNISAVETLLKLGVLPNNYDYNRTTPLMEACSLPQVNIPLIHMLLDYGCDVNMTNHYGFNALMMFASNSDNADEYEVMGRFFHLGGQECRLPIVRFIVLRLQPKYHSILASRLSEINLEWDSIWDGVWIK